MSLNILCQNIRLNLKEKVEVLEEQAITLQTHMILLQEHKLTHDKISRLRIM